MAWLHQQIRRLDEAERAHTEDPYTPIALLGAFTLIFIYVIYSGVSALIAANPEAVSRLSELLILPAIIIGWFTFMLISAVTGEITLSLTKKVTGYR